MEIILGTLGFFIGLFLWSNILGSFFGTLSIERHLVKTNQQQNVRWAKIIFPVIFAVLVLILTFILLRPFFIGTIPAAIVMLFNIGNLKSEAFKNHITESKEVEE